MTDPIARVSGGISEDVYDPKIPPEKQKVTYQTKEGKIKTVTKAELQDQLETSEKLMQSLNETWEEKLDRTQEVHKEREKALEELGITVEKNNVGVHTPKKVCHFVIVERIARKSLRRSFSFCGVDAAFGEPGKGFSLPFLRVSFNESKRNVSFHRTKVCDD